MVGDGKMIRALQVLITVLAIWVESIVESYGSQHTERVDEFMRAVTQAAEKSPRWHSHRERIRRDLEDIEYHLMAMIKAAKTTDRTKAEEARQQVQVLLNRGQREAYYTSDDAEALIRVLKKFLVEEDD
jgi:uncharacterized coiled-coil DUF342 family protein